MKLLSDFFLYKFSSWALLHNINPFFVKMYSRTLDIGYFPYGSFIGTYITPTFGLHAYKEYGFSLGDLFFLSLDPNVALGIFILVVCISLFLLMRCFLSNIKKYGRKTKFNPTVSNIILKEKLRFLFVKFYITEGFHSPYVKGLI